MNQTATIQIQSGQLMLRQAPDSQSAIIARLSKDRPVQVLAEAGDWYRLRAGNQEGYAAKAYVALSSPLPPASPVQPASVQPASVQPANMVPPVSVLARNSGSDDFQVEAGQLTFDAEGMEQRGRYFSRNPHVPTNSSGVTLGRGYDMRDKTPAMIQADLLACGLDSTAATRFAKAAGLSGGSGKSFITQNNLSTFEITPGQQKLLFALTYQQMVSDVLRICQKPDLVARYGTTDWAALPATVRDLVVDLRYRGDYTPSSRERLQPLLVRNNSSGIAQLMADEAYWCGPEKVPQDRFQRRRDYLR